MEYKSELWLDLTDLVFEYLDKKNTYNLCVTNKSINTKNRKLCEKIIEIDACMKETFSKKYNKFSIMPENLEFLFINKKNENILYFNEKMLILRLLYAKEITVFDTKTARIFMLNENYVNLLDQYLKKLEDRIQEFAPYRNQDESKSVYIDVSGCSIQLNIPVGWSNAYLCRYEKLVFYNLSALKILTRIIFSETLNKISNVYSSTQKQKGFIFDDYNSLTWNQQEFICDNSKKYY